MPAAPTSLEEHFKAGMRRLASGVCIVATAHEGSRHGLTVTAICSLLALRTAGTTANEAAPLALATNIKLKTVPSPETPALLGGRWAEIVNLPAAESSLLAKGAG